MYFPLKYRTNEAAGYTARDVPPTINISAFAMLSIADSATPSYRFSPYLK